MPQSCKLSFKSLHHPPLQRPPIFDATPESLRIDARALVERTQKVWNEIVNTVKPESATFTHVIEPIIRDENAKSTSMRLLRFYASTSPSKALRDASNAAVTLFTDSEVELFARADMYALVDAVMAQHLPDNGLSIEARNYLEKLHRRFWQNGCGITGTAVKSHFERSQKRLKDLERECNKNLHDEKTGLWLTREELHGVPSSFMSRLKEGEGEGEGEGEHEGHFWIATKVPQSSPVMKHATMEATRKKMFYAIQDRMPENVPLFRELVLLRDETARILGYPNHAALKTSSKMVKNPETVTSLLFEIKDRLVPRGAEYARELLELKRKETAARGEASDQIFLWDQSYYSRLQAENEKAHGSELSEYFELHTTLAKLLQMFEHMFATRFELITPEQQRDLGNNRPLIWHEDVLMFAVFDSDTECFMGYAYFDFHPREGKYTHVGHYSLQANFLQPDGTRFHASSALVMNYNKTADRATLLSLEEVRKLFHEIGHLIHALCTETAYAASQYVDRDFIEAPSLMFEQFFWQARHIKEVSFHYSHISPRYKEIWEASLPEKERQFANKMQPEAQLQDDVVAAMAKSSSGWKIVREQLKDVFFSIFDMTIHTPASHEALEAMNLAEVFNKLKSEIYSLPGGEVTGDGWEWGHGEAVRELLLF
ncbi:Saccharolysin [Cytospora mali]|uniref:Saccharolysin n=1 Tax=Cytospora mali TaxID=578113 RepID=A0A194VB83_CYTMA|nr:Saccharolysin [Valsa mali var. pyri (nom. inval.)]